MSDVAPRPLFGLVLAGGESRRMGRDKATLRRAGQTQLAYAMQLLDGVTERAFVSARPGQDDAERNRYEQIVDRYDGLGPIAGILTAMETFPDVDWLVIACDLPNVDAATLSHLLANRLHDSPFTAYISSHDGLPEPLCAIYAAPAAEIVRQFVADGVHCPRKVLIRSETRLLELPDARALDNVNTPEDLRRSVLEEAS